MWLFDMSNGEVRLGSMGGGVMQEFLSMDWKCWFATEPRGEIGASVADVGGD
jgi:hypothetical protein